MKLQRKMLTAAALAAALALAGCWDDDDNDEPTPPPVAATEVPDSAGVSTAAFVAFILGLGASDESSEPLIIKDAFAVPADEASEPTTLS